MRTIRVGDKVQAFLDVRVRGTVMEIQRGDEPLWMVGGTASPELFCILKLGNGHQVKFKMSELHHVDD